MGSESVDADRKLRIFFFPYTAAGHFFPMLHMAKLFSSHPSVSSVTVITTASNADVIAASPELSVAILPIPLTSLPDGWDSTSFPSSLADFHSVRESMSLLRDPLRRLLRSDPPHCLVSDMFLPWTAHVAADLGVPRVVFHGMSYFSLSVIEALNRYKPHDAVTDDREPFVVPGLPRAVVMTRAKLPVPLRSSADERFNSLADEMVEAESVKSYGVVVNSFYELEPEFADCYRRGRRAWHVGPVFLYNDDDDGKSVIDDGSLAKWLESKRTGSVIYVCFGSQVQLSADRLSELAAGLVRSKHCFLWVMKKDAPEILAEMDGERMLIVRGWAPQVAILKHRAVGGFLTHCGWNSVLECVTAGKAMVTLPVYGDQFFNEKLIVDELGIGARIDGEEGMITSGDVARAVESVMGEGDGAAAIRRRARIVGEMAGDAVADGGSSRQDMDRLMQELLDMSVKD